jgi:purine-binding chemotaxis protein CheW
MSMTTIHDAAAIGGAPDGSIEVLTFDIGGETLAVEAGIVREILDPLPVTRVPGANPLVGAVINFRGAVIPLADLHVALGMARGDHDADARVIVLELVLGGEAMPVAIGTDRVYEVTTLRAADAETPPEIGLRWPRAVLRALVRRAGDVVLVPDLIYLFQTLTFKSGNLVGEVSA